MVSYGATCITLRIPMAFTAHLQRVRCGRVPMRFLTYASVCSIREHRPTRNNPSCVRSTPEALHPRLAGLLELVRFSGLNGLYWVREFSHIIVFSFSTPTAGHDSDSPISLSSPLAPASRAALALCSLAHIPDTTNTNRF